MFGLSYTDNDIVDYMTELYIWEINLLLITLGISVSYIRILLYAVQAFHCWSIAVIK